MSMIGLLTGAPQTPTAKAASSDAAGAEGFGSTLQGALDALSEATTPEGLPAETREPGTESGTGTESGLSLSKPVELAETPPELRSPPHGRPMLAHRSEPAAWAQAQLVTSTSSVQRSTGSTRVESVGDNAVSLVETPGTEGGLSLSKPVEPVEASPELRSPPHGRSMLAHRSEPAAWAQAQLASLTTARPTDAGASFGTGGVGPGSTSVNSDVDNSLPLAPLVETPGTQSGLSLSKPVELADASPELRQAQLASTSSTRDAAPAAPPAAALVSSPQPVAPASSVAAPAPAASVPLATQLARPIFSLAAAGTGEHVMTVSVTPDNLGPVTVRAHVGADGVRVELFAPNDLGRDAIRAIIPELRRDLAGAGLGGNLSLSSQNQPSADGSAHGSGAGQPGERGERWAAGRATASADGSPAPTDQQVDRSGLFGTTSTIDVLA